MSVVRQVLDIRRYQQYIKPHQQRIKADAGSLVRDDRAKEFFDVLKQIGIYDSCKLAISPDFGIKTRVSGSNTFVSKGYSLVQNNDATQTTSTSQPHLGNIIAPNERPSLKNPNGQSKYMTHPTISFAANEAWSVTTVLNINYGGDFSFYCGDGIGSRWVGTYLKKLTFHNSVSDYYGISDISYIFGKIVTIIAVYDTAKVDIYVNGVLIETFITYGSMLFDNILKYLPYEPNSLKGTIYAHIIRAQALTPTQVAAEANFLRSLYPEIPSVQIGTQTWATSNCEMVATPQGNLIQNVTLNSNVEKITNAADRDFSSDTGFWQKTLGITISGGVCNFNTTGSGEELAKNLAAVGKRYIISFEIKNYTSGGIRVFFGGSYSQTFSGNGIFTTSGVQASTSRISFLSTGATVLSIDNVSVQEVGWSDATNLYNAIYAATSGTDEQKTYAAVKAAAMWCYYNNDPSLGAIYGKLYNWYAVKLLQMDIDYYNAANPSTPWGWKVPADTDFATLATTLGGALVAGGKMKKEGEVYWRSPNTGADNSSGFSAIPAGIRSSTGVFSDFSFLAEFKCVNTVVSRGIFNDKAALYPAYFWSNNTAEAGSSIRLIKS